MAVPRHALQLVWKHDGKCKQKRFADVESIGVNQFRLWLFNFVELRYRFNIP
jgi:hypothetical protein